MLTDVGAWLVAFGGFLSVLTFAMNRITTLIGAVVRLVRAWHQLKKALRGAGRSSSRRR